MKKTYKVRVRIKSIEGKCPMKFKVGQTWLIDKKTPGGMCQAAFHSIYSALRVFRFGGSHPWDKRRDITYVCCPDPENHVLYELRRIRSK
ncbi:MAG: TIGR04076 family protein [candidate division WOR-3 bacterium]